MILTQNRSLLAQVYNSEVMRSLKQKLVQVQLLLAWHMQDSGTSPILRFHVVIILTEIRFVQSILKAVNGASDIVEETFLYLPGISGGKEITESLGVDYFALPVKFGKAGAQKVFPVGSTSSHEDDLIKIAIEELKGNIKKGIDFMN